MIKLKNFNKYKLLLKYLTKHRENNYYSRFKDAVNAKKDNTDIDIYDHDTLSILSINPKSIGRLWMYPEKRNLYDLYEDLCIDDENYEQKLSYYSRDDY